ncbi:MAG: trehalose-6-phosphate synthase [Ectothiorhodospiraceae bacterium]|nr:trehalose-6-phosphate synthase [Ectothiorhodospiraceae bacterium]
MNDDNGKLTMKPGSGGLVTAMAPVLRNRGGLWIGWPGITSEREDETNGIIHDENQNPGYDLKPVHLNEQEVQNFYYGFANEIVWPLFHDLQSQCNFAPEYWNTYQRVNEKFADVILEHQQPEDFIWIHDYHLMSVARMLRQKGTQSKLGYFLHIPFPPIDIFMKIPWRFQILRDLLQYDLLGFQTPRDRRNFTQCVRALIKEARFKPKKQVQKCIYEHREIYIGYFPISIDYNEFADTAASEAVSNGAWYIHEDLPHQQIILGVDRLDYTKGIPNRFRAFRNFLRNYPELHEQITLIQVVVPSRTHIPMYAQLKEEIERLVGEINGEFTKSGWVPIHYIFRSLSRDELLAYYRTAEIALITPLKDGMNLVAKEYCASTVEEDGVLILSEFAGSAYEFNKHALLVNPYDLEGTAEAIHKAYNMPFEERQKRMKKMRGIVHKHDIFKWVDAFLRAAVGKDLLHFPIIDENLPVVEEIGEAQVADQL